MLSLTIFLNTVSEIIPITSDSPLIGNCDTDTQIVPFHTSIIIILGTYFNCIMFMVASSVVTTIMILNYHHRQSDMHQMPAWVGFYLYSVHFITERRERERERTREKYCNNLDKMLLSTGLLSVLSLRCFN